MLRYRSDYRCNSYKFCKTAIFLWNTNDLFRFIPLPFCWRRQGSERCGCFPLCQSLFLKFRSEFQIARFVSVSSDRNIRDYLWSSVRPKFTVPFLTNRFFALIREFGKRIWNDNIHFYWLARFNRKMSFHFPQIFPLISDRLVWHNGKHPVNLHQFSRPTL